MTKSVTLEQKNINIAIDALGTNEIGGAQSVTIPLLKIVFQNKKDWNFHCFLSAYEKELDFPNVKQIILPISKGLGARIVFQFIAPFYTIFHKINIFHFIKSQPSIVLFTKKILTIYDCTILKYPDYFGFASRMFWKYLQPIYCRKMNKITTLSEDAKSEISKYLFVPPEKIEVLYPAPQFIDDEILSTSEDEILKHYALDRQYLLYIGQIGYKKNLDTLIKAYKIAKEKNPDLPILYMVGPKYYLSDASEIFDLIDNLNLEQDIIYWGAVPKSDLQIILQNAKMLLFPSKHEGFGIPLVEAMKFGVPVISSNTSVMPEVLNSAGMLVDDYMSPKAWADQILHLHENIEEQALLIKKGKQRAHFFSWEKTAKKLVQVYENLL